MATPVLTILRLVFLLLLYLFLWRVVRTIATDLSGVSRRRSAPPRQPVATSSAGTSTKDRGTRKAPREVVVYPPEGKPEVVALSGGSIVIGRGGNSTVLVDDVYVSDEHTELVDEEGTWLVRDLGSTNGTHLNGAKVTRATALASGDQIRLGKTRMEVRR